jgi:putative peptide zinc metalloprotease protein
VTPPPGAAAPPATVAPVAGRRPDGAPPDGADGNGHRAAADLGAAARPARAHGVELLGEMTGSGYRRAPGLVRRGDGQTLQLTPLLYQVLEAIDGRRGYPEIATAVSQRIGKLAAADDVWFLTETKLRPLGVLRQPDGAEPEVTKSNPLLALRFRMVVSNPEVTRRITAPFAYLFLPPVVLAVVVAFLLTSWWLLFEKGLASAANQAFYEPGLLLLVFGLTMLSAGFHEFGHAAACRYGGATPGAMGVGLYLVWPAFYTEVTDSYRLGRRGRLRVDLGGLYFNAIFAVAMLGAWTVTRWDALLLLIPAQLLQMARQLAPLVRFDGYHILADLTGVPDLFWHIKPTLLGLLPTRWGRAHGKHASRTGRSQSALKPWARAVVTLWVLIVVPVLAFCLVMMVRVLPRIAATAWDSLGLQWEAFGHNWADGDLAGMGVRLLSVLALTIPVLSITYLLARIVRRTTRRVWQATGGRPALRAAAAVTGVMLLALVAWAWWPEGQYRPIEADEGGTLLGGALPMTEMASGEPVLTAADSDSSRSATPARQMRATGTVPAAVRPSPSAARSRQVFLVRLEPLREPSPAAARGAHPEADAPAPQPQTAILVLDPPPEPGATETAPRSGWIFPFDPPPEPSEGDNQAVAINTEDGSAVFDVAFALLLVTDERVEQRNEAYAMASCRDCKTVAVAFQAILMIGRIDVVTPVNVAVAANYSCVDCVTHAVAVQLVASLNDVPSDEVMQELGLVWTHLERIKENVESLGVEQIYNELMAVEAAILEILVRGGAQVATDTDVAQDSSINDGDMALTPQTAPTVTSTATPDPDPAEGTTATPTSEPTTTPTSQPGPGPTATSEPSPSPSPTATSETAPAPTSEPSPAPTSEPSPAPTADP